MNKDPLARCPAPHHIRGLIERVVLARKERLLHPIAPQFAPKKRVLLQRIFRESAEKMLPKLQIRGGGGVGTNPRPTFRLLAALGCAASLSACGFHSLYGNTALDLASPFAGEIEKKINQAVFDVPENQPFDNANGVPKAAAHAGNDGDGKTRYRL